MKFLSLCASLFLLAASAQAQEKFHDPQHCFAIETPMPQQQGGVCIYPGDKNADVLYYLHGKDGNAETWASEGFWSQQIRDYWKAKGYASPTIVTVSLGEIWLLAPKTEAPAGFGMMDLFVGRILPSIEQKLGGVKGRRLLLGDSMGGFNSIQLGLKTDLFAKVAALCAPMAEGVGPYSADADVEKYIRASTALRSGKQSYETLKDRFDTIRMVVSVFWDEKSWPASDPIEMARGLRAPRAAKWYLAAGFFDSYLAYEGNVAFAKILAQSGTNVEWRPQWGDHCAVDIPSLGDFLVK